MLVSAGTVIKDPTPIFFGTAMKLDRHGIEITSGLRLMLEVAKLVLAPNQSRGITV